MLETVTETSPLLGSPENEDDRASQQESVHVLVDVIGARHLVSANQLLQPYCVAQYGTKTIHKTRPSNGLDPIWTLETNSLFVLPISRNEVANNKHLRCTIWAKTEASVLGDAARKVVSGTKTVQFHGKIRVNVATILSYCNEERIELDLLDEMGRQIKQGEGDESGPTPTLALRFRVATKADIRFVQVWNAHQSLDANVLRGTGLVGDDEKRKRATLVTELDENEVGGARLLSASRVASPRGTVRVKPNHDPKRPETTQYMKPEALKVETQLPSHNWIEAGSGTLGRVYVEILSCHGLPNIDVGSTVGNLTDSFVSVVYEDSLVETDVIDDELSPHWLPWTQRAFAFNMMHPSSVMYIAVFGYKRRLLNHGPIGRVEINPVNLQRDTVYNLRYDLSSSSHTTERKTSGSIKVRLRLERNDERAALLAALKPAPPIYLNVQKQKSFPVARYTCRGEYDSEEKFDVKVLLAYRDEHEGYLHRIVYCVSDATQSLIWWRGQVRIGRIWFPLHSLILFCMGVTFVEIPSMFPALFCLCIAWFMLANMYCRLQEPIPWRRCFSFGHYFRILVFGQSVQSYEEIESGQGYEQARFTEIARKKRIDEHRRALEQKEAVEEEIRKVEHDSMETKVAQMIDIELLTVLGRLQGDVGGLCRLFRFIDVILTWEESALAFWITATSLAVGLLALLLPWAFILIWSARILVWGLLGPHMKLVDLTRQSPKDHSITQLLALRLYHARLRQEVSAKLKAVRAGRYGKYSTSVPGIMWTPHQDRPLAESDARLMMHSADNCTFPAINDELPCIPGQQLYGGMIPRPEREWAQNRESSKQQKERAETELFRSRSTKRESLAMNTVPSTDGEGNEALRDRGVEVVHDYDEEAVSRQNPSEDSFFSNLFGKRGSTRLKNMVMGSVKHPVNESVKSENREWSKQQKERAETELFRSRSTKKESLAMNAAPSMDVEALPDRGVEVVHDYDEEAASRQNPLEDSFFSNLFGKRGSTRPKNTVMGSVKSPVNESVKRDLEGEGDAGLEVLDVCEEEGSFVDSVSHEELEDDLNTAPSIDIEDSEALRDRGVEVVHDYDEEAASRQNPSEASFFSNPQNMVMGSVKNIVNESVKGDLEGEGHAGAEVLDVCEEEGRFIDSVPLEELEDDLNIDAKDALDDYGIEVVNDQSQELWIDTRDNQYKAVGAGESGSPKRSDIWSRDSDKVETEAADTRTEEPSGLENQFAGQEVDAEETQKLVDSSTQEERTLAQSGSEAAQDEGARTEAEDVLDIRENSILEGIDVAANGSNEASQLRDNTEMNILQASVQELGVEVLDVLDEEAQFVQALEEASQNRMKDAGETSYDNEAEEEVASDDDDYDDNEEEEEKEQDSSAANDGEQV